MNIEDAAVVQAMFDAIPQEQKDELLLKAIQSHLTPTGYSHKTSPLQDTFNHAVRDVARKIVNEELAKPENREKIRVVVQEVFTKLTDDNREAFASSIAGKIVEEMWK